MSEDKSRLVEALIFAAPEPIDALTIAGLIDEEKPERISGYVDALNEEYDL